MLKPRQRRALEDDAKRNPGGQAAQILKSLMQEEAKAADLIKMASEQAKKDLNRQKILIGISMINEAEKNPSFKAGIEKVLSKHINDRDREFMARYGWELENENIKNDSNSTPSTTQ